MQTEEETKEYLTKPRFTKMAVKMEAGKNHTHSKVRNPTYIHTHVLTASFQRLPG